MLFFFFDIFISYYLRYDKVKKKKSEMQKLCYTTKYCKKQKNSPPNEPTAIFAKRKARINKIGPPHSPLFPQSSADWSL